MFTAPNPELRTRVVAAARGLLEQRPVFLDTETTGLDGAAEIVEIAITDTDGSVLFESLVRPSKPIPYEATAIHHISNDMVRNARPWLTIFPTVRSILAGRLIAIYNEEYDTRLMRQSHAAYRLPWKETFQTTCVMKLYAQFRAEWDPRRRSYRYFSLDAAGKQCRLSLPNSHRATDDTLLTRALLYYMAGIDPNLPPHN